MPWRGTCRRPRSGIAWARQLWWLLGLFALPVARSDYYPAVDPSSTWQAPRFQPWDPLRATHTSITVAWTPGWNPWCNIDRYELDTRRPAGAPLHFADLEGLQFRELDRELPDWPGDQHWTAWEDTYVGAGRVYIKRIPAGTAHAVQFRVRACGKCGATFFHDCSAWSKPQTGHTLVNSIQDKVNFHIRGTGKNSMDYAIIEVDHHTIYKRRDETGLILAAFLRLDFSLQWLRSYNTHHDRDAALEMARDLRRFNASYFVFVVSSIAWEWRAPRTLVQTMEFCGAYHFGQWAHVFAEQDHYYSNFSDLQQTASQDEFGHPYAFIGIPGIGSGMGWESLMHNTGQYLAPNVQPQHAVIRGVASYDYVARIFRLHDVEASKVGFYAKGQPPAWESLHNPVPKRKQSTTDLQLGGPGSDEKFVPYTGTLQKHITKLVEANQTVPPYNFAFMLTTDAEVRKVDPRPRKYWITELERVWSGPSARYWQHNGTRIQVGVELPDRQCSEFIYYGYTGASPEVCGADFSGCCPDLDTPNFTAVACNVGVSPTVCRNNEHVMLQNHSVLFSAKWPYPFRILSWQS